MKKRPLLFGLATLSLTLILAYSVYSNLGAELSYLHYSLLGAYWLALTLGAISAWKPRPWGHFAITLSVTLVTFIEAYSFSADGFTFSTVLGAFAVGFGVFLMGEKQLQALYYFSSRRWWETPKRHLVNAIGTIEFEKNVDKFEIQNISETGCLAHSSARPPDESSVRVRLNDNLLLEARVVRVAGDYLGLRFNFKSRQERIELKQFIRFKLAQQTIQA